MEYLQNFVGTFSSTRWTRNATLKFPLQLDASLSIFTSAISRKDRDVSQNIFSRGLLGPLTAEYLIYHRCKTIASTMYRMKHLQCSSFLSTQYPFDTAWRFLFERSCFLQIAGRSSELLAHSSYEVRRLCHTT